METDLNSLRQWIKDYLTVLVNEPSERIDVNEPLAYFDLDSIDAIIMGVKLEDAFGIEIHPETFLDATSSIEGISRRILQMKSPNSHETE